MARKAGSNGAQTAQDIRSTALRLFAERGYAAVSMREIARAVGVQAGALYLYTPDKQSLLADLMIDHLESLLAAWGGARSTSADPADRLAEFVRFHIHFHLSRVDAVFIAYMELRNLNPENFTKIERLRRLYEAELEEILDDGVAQGRFRLADPRITALALIAMLTGIGTWYRPGGRLTPAQIEETYRQMVFATVGAPAPGPAQAAAYEDHSA